MIEYDKQLTFGEIFCDQPNCLHATYSNGTWTEVVATAKGKGWSLKKMGGAWCHYCPLHNPWEKPNTNTNTGTNEDINPDEIPF